MVTKKLPLVFITGNADYSREYCNSYKHKIFKNPDILSFGLTVDISIIIPVLFYFFCNEKV